jgi:hypothetical protein
MAEAKFCLAHTQRHPSKNPQCTVFDTLKPVIKPEDESYPEQQKIMLVPIRGSDLLSSPMVTGVYAFLGFRVHGFFRV